MKVTRAEHMLMLVHRAKAYTGEHGMLPTYLPADLWTAMRDAADSLLAEHERWQSMLEHIRQASPSEADQCPFWAGFALEMKDINGDPMDQSGKDPDE